METFYGKSWDVKSIPNAENIAYTDLNLPLHMDLMYFEDPPKLQLLHSIKNEVSGGLSTFKDSRKILNAFQNDFPVYYDTLKRVRVCYQYQGVGQSIKLERMLIEPRVGEDQLNYAPMFFGVLNMKCSDADMFYPAFEKFMECVESPNNMLLRKAEEGDLVVFLNRRMLHGRTAFESNSGQRFLKGAYVSSADYSRLLKSLCLE